MTLSSSQATAKSVPSTPSNSIVTLALVRSTTWRLAPAPTRTCPLPVVSWGGEVGTGWNAGVCLCYAIPPMAPPFPSLPATAKRLSSFAAGTDTLPLSWPVEALTIWHGLGKRPGQGAREHAALRQMETSAFHGRTLSWSSAQNAASPRGVATARFGRAGSVPLPRSSPLLV